MDLTLKYSLSGPMTGLPDYNYDYFTWVAKHLRATGYKILSPHEIDYSHRDNGVRGSLPWQTYIKEAIRLLIQADAIIMLPGWASSKGARVELDIALDMGYPAYLLSIPKENNGELFDLIPMTLEY